MHGLENITAEPQSEYFFGFWKCLCFSFRVPIQSPWCYQIWLLLIFEDQNFLPHVRWNGYSWLWLSRKGIVITNRFRQRPLWNRLFYIVSVVATHLLYLSDSWCNVWSRRNKRKLHSMTWETKSQDFIDMILQPFPCKGMTSHMKTGWNFVTWFRERGNRIVLFRWQLM